MLVSDTESSENEHQNSCSDYVNFLMLNHPTEAVASKMVKTKLTDVNGDCLEKIFMYLNLDDLLNIAHTNKQLKFAADLAFARKFGKCVMLLYIHRVEWNSKFFLFPNTVCIIDLQTSLRLLRCFGHLLSHLDIRCSSDFPNASYKLTRYANEYCSESLTKIEFGAMKNVNDTFQSLSKPFVTVENIRFYGCILEADLTKIDALFPARRGFACN